MSDDDDSGEENGTNLNHYEVLAITIANADVTAKIIRDNDGVKVNFFSYYRFFYLLWFFSLSGESGYNVTD